MKGGSQQISAKMLEKIGQKKLLLNHKATEVLQKDGQVKVKFANGTQITAKKVISTIPPNIVAKNLHFQPGS